MQELPDGAAMAASIDDSRAFGVIFDRHFDAIFRYLQRRVGRDAAEDLAAETFTRAFAKRGDFRADRADARPWLFGFAVNLLRNHLRREQRELHAYARTGIDPIGHHEPRLDAINQGRDRAIAASLAEMEPGDREVLLLFAWADLGYGEIAEALALPIGTVRSRLYRVRARLRQRMFPHESSIQEAADG
jgi:RNA polymerase sigma factor (sigma-70 family)